MKNDQLSRGRAWHEYIIRLRNLTLIILRLITSAAIEARKVLSKRKKSWTGS